ncbi:hypothetical protein [Rhodobacter capsulatus]|uniref:hypothetical protein n=1 Tax=Rhodobacter capsulatus TaxID=1061 RepID=UPI004027D707
MVGASKILTVSYGTFSCTLEGFDEPFTTMKAIAEYFRDLAAEDRYFGAEPPQPDAEMLHRIAEREMARRVEAKIEKNGVILRPGAAEAQPSQRPAEPAAAPLSVAPPLADTAAPVAAPVLMPVMVPVTPVPPPGPAPAEETVSDPISDSVAAKLQRIRSAVAQARAAQTVADPDPDPEIETAAEEAAGETAIAAPEDFGFALDISGPLGQEEAQAIGSGDADAGDDEGDEETDGAEDPQARPAVHDPEKAERMRRRAERRAARQLQAETEAPPAPPQPEVPTDAQPETPETVATAAAESPAEPAPTEPARPVIRARVIKLRRAEVPPAAAVTPATQTEPDTAEDEIARVMAAISAAPPEAPAPEAPVAEAPVSEAAISEAPAPEAEAAAPDGLSPEAEAELMAELAALTDNLGDADWGIEGWSGDGWGNAPAAPEPAEPLVLGLETETARVIAQSAPTAEIAAEIEAPAADPVAEPVADPADQPAEDGTEPEAAAQDAADPAPAQPAPAEIDLDALFAEPEPLPPGFVDRRAPVAAPQEPIALAPRPAAKAPSLPEGDLPRLLEKADAQMAGNENRRRISAIAHLKAAVAATVAERRAGTEEIERDATAPYRQDLTQAVRPRRPVLPPVGESHHQSAARPEPRPAPLVLVSEQRVDRAPAEAVAKAQAVRPRRITTSLLAQDVELVAQSDEEIEVPLSPEEASSFAEFAQSRAPQGLAELLEAAAAYTAQVEGRPHFSPPQIMSKVSAVGDESFSREDRLRVFGTLLRQGKIAKVKRGQYAITEASRFYQARSEAQIARR